MLRVEEDRKMGRMTYHLAWAADLHLEFLSPEKFDLFLQSLRDVQADGLLVCGDISTSPRLRQRLVALSTIGNPVYFVCGNHDYYRGSFDKTAAMTKATCREHHALRWLSQGEIIPLTSRAALLGHDGWGDGRAGLGIRSTIGMNDFVLIEDLRILIRMRHASTRPHPILKFEWQVPATAIQKWKASSVSEAPAVLFG